MKKTTLAVLLATILAVFATAAPKTYKMKLSSPAVVAGSELQPGEYKLDVQGDKLVVTKDKAEVASTPVKLETGNTKFVTTQVSTETINGKRQVNEIELGGTSTRLVLTGAATASAK